MADESGSEWARDELKRLKARVKAQQKSFSASPRPTAPSYENPRPPAPSYENPTRSTAYEKPTSDVAKLQAELAAVKDAARRDRQRIEETVAARYEELFENLKRDLRREQEPPRRQRHDRNPEEIEALRRELGAERDRSEAAIKAHKAQVTALEAVHREAMATAVARAHQRERDVVQESLADRENEILRLRSDVAALHRVLETQSADRVLIDADRDAALAAIFAALREERWSLWRSSKPPKALVLGSSVISDCRRLRSRPPHLEDHDLRDDDLAYELSLLDSHHTHDLNDAFTIMDHVDHRDASFDFNALLLSNETT